MKVQLLAAASAGALALFVAGTALADDNTVSGSGSAGGRLSGTSVAGAGSAAGDLTTVSGAGAANGDLTTVSGAGSAGDDLTNINRSNSGTKVSDGTLNTGNDGSRGGSVNTGGTNASNGGTNNSGQNASRGGSVNSGTSATDGGTNNSGQYASRGSRINTGTDASNGGVVNTGNNASRGGQIQTGAGDLGGDSITNSGARTRTRVSTDQDLDATVSGNTTWMSATTGSPATGAVTLSNAGVAGVQTVSVNSGLNSSAQASTSIAASAAITFGSGT
jgi:hypothetical protein